MDSGTLKEKRKKLNMLYALSQPIRLKIAVLLKESEKGLTFDDIYHKLDIKEKGLLAYHLEILKNSGVVYEVEEKYRMSIDGKKLLKELKEV